MRSMIGSFVAVFFAGSMALAQQSSTRSAQLGPPEEIKEKKDAAVAATGSGFGRPVQLGLPEEFKEKKDGNVVATGSGSGKIATTQPTTQPPAFIPERGPATPRIWGSAEYLLWWVRNAPLPVPLVTANDTQFSRLDRPGTTVLYGGNSQSFGAFSGMRFTVGGWINADRIVGIEGSVFLLEKRTAGFEFRDPAAGSTNFVGIPVNNAPTKLEEVFFTTSKGKNSSVVIDNSLQLWGGELNGHLNVIRNSVWEANVLTGFRYVDLNERFSLINTFNPIPTFGFIESDFFATRNQFYGGQLGTRVFYRRGILTAEWTSKISLGATHQTQEVAGRSDTIIAGKLTTTSPDGIFARTSNSGRRTHNVFTVIPESQFKVGVDLTSRLRATVGYDFLYWSSVVRPGNQIDRVVDLSPAATRPLPQFDHSRFWTQGFSFGLDFRY